MPTWWTVFGKSGRYGCREKERREPLNWKRGPWWCVYVKEEEILEVKKAESVEREPPSEKSVPEFWSSASATVLQLVSTEARNGVETTSVS